MGHDGGLDEVPGRGGGELFGVNLAVVVARAAGDDVGRFARFGREGIGGGTE